MLNVAVSERRMAAHTASEQAPCSPAATRSTNFPLPLPARFLDASEAVGETVVLASYPRSGNSLLRSLLESISGVVTGSDTRADRTLSLALQECGVRGEGVIDERAWVVKSHYPERRGCARFAAKRAILLVRNPWDVIDSYFNMTLTNSHNTTMRDDQYARFEELFRGLARAEADVWARFNRWWLRAPIPLLVVRYEDLVHHRHRTLRRVAWFLRGCDPLEGTRWADRVDAACGAELDASGFYAPRRGGARRVGSSLRRRGSRPERQAARWLLGSAPVPAADDRRQAVDAVLVASWKALADEDRDDARGLELVTGALATALARLGE